MRQFRFPVILLAMLTALALAACSSDSPAPTAVPTQAPTTVPTVAPTAVPTAVPIPTTVPTPTPVPLSESFKGVRGIIDPTNLDWPREVEGLNGLVSIPAKPERIITASVGHDEMTLALVPLGRLVGVGKLDQECDLLQRRLVGSGHSRDLARPRRQSSPKHPMWLSPARSSRQRR